MAELIRKFFELNDTTVIIVAFIYFSGVIGCFIYFWRKDDEERLYKTKNDTHRR